MAAVYRTFAQHPALYVTRQVLSEHIRLGSTLSPRVREMLILRIGYLCQSAYEWAAHARAGRAAGLSADEIRRIAAGPDAGWSAADAAILRAVDEIYATDVVSEATWKELGAQFDRERLLDVLITAGATAWCRWRSTHSASCSSQTANRSAAALDFVTEVNMGLSRTPGPLCGAERRRPGWFCWWHRWRGHGSAAQSSIEGGRMWSDLPVTIVARFWRPGARMPASSG